MSLKWTDVGVHAERQVFPRQRDQEVETEGRAEKTVLCLTKTKKHLVQMT